MMDGMYGDSMNNTNGSLNGQNMSFPVDSPPSGNNSCVSIHTVQITFIFIYFRVCDFAFAFKTQNAPCVSRFKRILFSDRFTICVLNANETFV